MPTLERKHPCPKCKFKVSIPHCPSPTCTWFKCNCVSPDNKKFVYFNEKSNYIIGGPVT